MVVIYHDDLCPYGGRLILNVPVLVVLFEACFEPLISLMGGHDSRRVLMAL